MAKSFFITDKSILKPDDDRSAFSLHNVLGQLVTQANITGVTRQSLYNQWWDTQADGTGSALGCDHEQTDGHSSFNGFRWQCPREERRLSGTNPFDSTSDDYVFPIAVVNRFDLAPEDGSDCGEYRIVYARSAGLGRNYLIFEARLPNPNPTCGLDACRAVTEFFANLSLDTLNVDTFISRLSNFYFNGLTGFSKVVDLNNYTLSSGGAIRTNSFIDGHQGWMTKEFNLQWVPMVSLQMVPSTVAVNPHPSLFDESNQSQRALDFRQQFLNEVPSLASADINQISMNPASTFNSGASIASGAFPPEDAPLNDYALFFSSTGVFAQAIAGALPSGSTLTAADIVNRATTQTCAGCHALSNGVNLGGGLTWPESIDFVFTDENQTQAGPYGDAFKIADALTNTFLPHRRRVMVDFLNNGACSCSGDGLRAQGSKRRIGGRWN